MKQVTTAIAVLAAALFLTACGKKEEPAAAPEAAPADSSVDASQSGGDQVKP